MGLRNRKAFSHFQCFFVTTVCNNHMKVLQSDVCKKIVADSISFLNEKYKARTLGYVIMPNHLHLIVYFEEENKLSDYMRDLKKYTAFEIRRFLEGASPELFEKLRYYHREQLFKVWDDGFDDVWLESRWLLETKLEYIHHNPLQEHWRLVELPEDYFYSSAAFYEREIQTGILVSHYLGFF
jgi:putative transposase